jgi:hypothetical protein
MCKDCNTNVYNMKCIRCAARHCKGAFYPDLSVKWEYVKQISAKYNHNARELAEIIRGER